MASAIQVYVIYSSTIGLIEKYVHQAACDSFHSWLNAVRDKITILQEVRVCLLIYSLSSPSLPFYPVLSSLLFLFYL